MNLSEFLCISPGDSTCGQRAIYHSLGLSGIPIVNVNNNCSTGSTALFMARQLIQGGEMFTAVCRNPLQKITHRYNNAFTYFNIHCQPFVHTEITVTSKNLSLCLCQVLLTVFLPWALRRWKEVHCLQR